jgi:hypothetical protein
MGTTVLVASIRDEGHAFQLLSPASEHNARAFQGSFTLDESHLRVRAFNGSLVLPLEAYLCPRVPQIRLQPPSQDLVFVEQEIELASFWRVAGILLQGPRFELGRPREDAIQAGFKN